MKTKASFRDTLLVPIIIFIFVITSLISILILSKFNNEIQSSTIFPAESKSFVSTVNTRAPIWLDGAFIFAYVVLVVIGVILAFLIRSSVIFIPISIIFFLLLTFITRVFASIYTRMAADSTLSAIAASMPISAYVMPKLHIFSFIAGVLIIGVMVMKRGGN